MAFQVAIRQQREFEEVLERTQDRRKAEAAADRAKAEAAADRARAEARKQEARSEAPAVDDTGSADSDAEEDQSPPPGQSSETRGVSVDVEV